MKNPFESELERLARTLTEQLGVQVICQGDSAWTDGSRIVVPSVPEPINEDLERMMLGYLDHEMAHVAFSDFEVAAEFERKHPGSLGMLNVVEDALIERRAMEKWPGVRRNLDRMFAQIKPRVRQLVEQRGPFDRFCTAVYLRLSHHDDMMGLEPELAGFEDLLDEFGKVRSTRDAADLATRALERWQARKPSAGLQPKPSSSDGPENTDDHTSDGDGSGSDPKARSQSGDSGAGESACQTGDHAASGHTDAARSSSETAAEGSPQPDSPPQPGESSGEGETDSNSHVARSGAGALPGSLIGDALRESIEQQVGQIDGTTQYRPYTREHDGITVVSPSDPAEVSMLLEMGRDTVRRLRRGLTNALRSAEKRWWRQDQLRGELSPRTLHRLCMDRPRLDVFRVRSTVQGQSTAVSILLDASGSMSRRKMDVARGAMRVLIEALADLKIPAEALTFTTGNAVDICNTMQQTGLDARKLREHYGRLSNLEIGLIQQFGESVKTALSRLPSVHGSGLTPLGEAMQIAAARLVHRRETRRILLVLTDGKAGCEGGSEAATIHAQDMAARVAKAGIELVGVGILDENIRDVVAESIVIHTLEDLPAQLCKLLGRTLMRGVRRVG